MTKKTKQTEEESAMGNWKNIVQGFVGNMLEQISDNVNHKIQAWIKMLKRKAIGSILMIFGLLYLLIGLSIYCNSILSPIAPGLGYTAVGVLAMMIGYLVSNNNSK